mmetsp:Transcript_25897/g.50601  ORF Transcript_25897/g.50601 Transcript_25897/m.50601 type:complete len:291 (-) Transcript_25897:296-1168(-)
MGSGASRGQAAATASAEAPSAMLRAGLAGGYGGLIAVNYVFGKGAFGLPTNSVLSARWPSAITPKGYAFAIWGIIFALQGGSVMVAVWPAKEGSTRARLVNAVGASWMRMWALENAWQLCFWGAAFIAPSDSIPKQLTVMLPCSVMLWGACEAGLEACTRLCDVPDGGMSAAVFKLASALNAGWLSAASCIGTCLVGHSLCGGIEKTPTALPIALATAATLQGVSTIHKFGPGWLGLGYAGAVAWALQAVRFGPNVPKGVREAALVGLVTLGGASVYNLAFHATGPKKRN